MLRSTVGSTQRACLDLAAIRGDGQVGNRVFSFSGTMGHEYRVSSLMRGLDGGQRLRKCAGLVYFDQNRASDPFRYSARQQLGVRAGHIITDQLDCRGYQVSRVQQFALRES